MTAPGANTVALSQSVRYSETALCGLYEISKIVASPSSLKVMLNNVVSVMSSFLDMRLATLVLLGRNGAPGIAVAASTERTMIANRNGGIPGPVIAQVSASATPLVIEDCAGHSLFAGCNHFGTISPTSAVTFIGVPIRGRSKAVGMLAIERLWEHHAEVRIDHDVRLLTMVANILAQTLKVHCTVADARSLLIFEEERQPQKYPVHKLPKPRAPKIEGILGRSPALKAVTERIEQVAQSNVPVLIRGETGTGKELFARAIHDLSRRKAKAFVAVNCAALPESVIESELFGHEKGAFTGAVATRKGRFELADGGTIFLDEIGDISPSFQAKLLRVLQEGEFERVGGQHTLKVNFRLVCATNRNLEDLVKQEKFRADLYYRISVVPLILPPLRERPGDIPELAAYFLEKFGEENGLDLHFAPSAFDVLCRCAFPGNVRELENCVRRTAALAAATEIQDRDFACQQGQCLSGKLWNKPGCSPAQSRSAGKLGPSPAAPLPPASPDTGPDPGLPLDVDGAETGSLLTDAIPAGKNAGAYQELSKEMLVQAMEKTGWNPSEGRALFGLEHPARSVTR